MKKYKFNMNIDFEVEAKDYDDAFKQGMSKFESQDYKPIVAKLTIEDIEDVSTTSNDTKVDLFPSNSLGNTGTSAFSYSNGYIKELLRDVENARTVPKKVNIFKKFIERLKNYNKE